MTILFKMTDVNEYLNAYLDIIYQIVLKTKKISCGYEVRIHKFSVMVAVWHHSTGLALYMSNNNNPGGKFSIHSSKSYKQLCQTLCFISYAPHYEKTGFLHMRKQK